MSKTVAMILAAVALAGCSVSASGSDSTPGSDSPVLTSAPIEDSTTTTTTNPNPLAATPGYETKVTAAEAVVNAWSAVLEESAKIVKLPYKTSPGGQPVIYDNGCHLGWSTIKPRLCEFGNLTSNFTVVITGDSHAAHWFGAFEEAAIAWGWRLVSVTKRGCPAADVHVNKSTEDGAQTEPVAYTACDEWRVASQKFIRDLKPDVVVFPMLTRRGVIGTSGEGTAKAWREGLVRSITAVTKGTDTKVLVLSNTPKTIGSPIPSCLWGHAANIRPCVNKRSVAAPAKYADNLAEAARIAKVGFVDVTSWICAAKFCPAVVNKVMVYRDSHHLSDKFSRMLSSHVALAINQLFEVSSTTQTSVPNQSSSTMPSIVSSTTSTTINS